MVIDIVACCDRAAWRIDAQNDALYIVVLADPVYLFFDKSIALQNCASYCDDGNFIGRFWRTRL